MNDKLELTVRKTIDALARIERFFDKYGEQLSDEQVARIKSKLREIQKKSES